MHIVENGNPNDQNPAFKIQDPQSALQGILRELHHCIARDHKVKQMEEVLEGFIPAERNRPRKLGDMEVWLEAKRYRRLDVYQGHMFSLFEAVRERSLPGSDTFKISLDLHKKFIQKRVEVTKSGERFTSPACTYIVRDINDSLEDLKKRREEGNFSPSQGESWDVDPSPSVFDVETEDLETEIQMGTDPGAQYYLQVYCRPNTPSGTPGPAVLYKLDDCVYLSVNDTRGPRVARITRIWRDQSGVMMFRGPVYLRPEETAHEPVRNFHFQELILSQNEQNYPLASIRGRCIVLVKPDYQGCRPVNIIEKHVYFQESKYSEVMENGMTQGVIRKVRTHKRYNPTNRVIDDEYLYFEEGKQIPLLPTPSPRLDQLVKQEIRKRSMEAQQVGATPGPANPPMPPQPMMIARPPHPGPPHHGHPGVPPFGPHPMHRPPMHHPHPHGSPYHPHPGHPGTPPGMPPGPPHPHFIHRLPNPHMPRPQIPHSPHGGPHGYTGSPGPHQMHNFPPVVSSPAPPQPRQIYPNGGMTPQAIQPHHQPPIPVPITPQPAQIPQPIEMVTPVATPIATPIATPTTTGRKKGARKGTGLSTTGYTIFSASINKTVRF